MTDHDQQAIYALRNLSGLCPIADDDSERMCECDIPEWTCRAIIAAIKRGDVPGVNYSESPKGCCKEAVDEARRRWRACGDTVSQETAQQISDLKARLAQVTKQLEVTKRAERLCPDCRDKVPEGHCPRCGEQAAIARAEAAERELSGIGVQEFQRTRAALHDSQAELAKVRGEKDAIFARFNTEAMRHGLVCEQRDALAALLERIGEYSRESGNDIMNKEIDAALEGITEKKEGQTP